MPKKEKKQKFFAINWKDSGVVWVETCSGVPVDAIERLDGDNTKLILTEAEAKTILMYLITEFLK